MTDDIKKRLRYTTLATIYEDYRLEKTMTDIKKDLCCYVTMNPCGTDKLPKGQPCFCFACRSFDRIEELERERDNAEGALSRRTMERDDLRGRIEELEAEVLDLKVANDELIAAALGEADD